MRKLVIGIGLVLVMALVASVQAAPVVTLSLVLGDSVLDPAGVAGPTSTTFQLLANVTGNTYTVTGTTAPVSLGISQVTLDLDFGPGMALTVPDNAGVPDATLNASDFGGTWAGLYQVPTWKGTGPADGLGLDNFLVSENPNGGNQISAPDANILGKFKRGRGVDILLASGTLTPLSVPVDTLVSVSATPSFANAVVVWAAANPNPAATNRALINAVAVTGAGLVNNATGQILVKAIPEPATIGLLGLSGLLMLWRRR